MSSPVETNQVPWHTKKRFALLHPDAARLINAYNHHGAFGVSFEAARILLRRSLEAVFQKTVRTKATIED